MKVYAAAALFAGLLAVAALENAHQVAARVLSSRFEFVLGLAIFLAGVAGAGLAAFARYLPRRGIAVFAIDAALAIAFAAQNLHSVPISLVGFETTLPLGLALAVPFFIGAVLGAALGPRPSATATPAFKEPAASEAETVAAISEPVSARRAVGAAHTDAGKKRDTNEDSHVVDNDLLLYIVCDGMGGHAAGEVASGIAASTVARLLQAARARIDEVRAEAAPSGALLPELKTAVNDASKAIISAAETRPEWHNMGCTITCLLVAGPSEAVFAHVGDTRLYKVRRGEVEQLSRDHSVGAELAAAGVLSDKEGHEGPLAHALTRSLGQNEEVDVDTAVVATRPGDLFILCSDGLSDYLGPGTEASELGPLLAAELANLPRGLVDFANRAGGHDNITVVAVKIGD